MPSLRRTIWERMSAELYEPAGGAIVVLALMVGLIGSAWSADPGDEPVRRAPVLPGVEAGVPGDREPFTRLESGAQADLSDRYWQVLDQLMEELSAPVPAEIEVVAPEQPEVPSSHCGDGCVGTGRDIEQWPDVSAEAGESAAVGEEPPTPAEPAPSAPSDQVGE